MSKKKKNNAIKYLLKEFIRMRTALKKIMDNLSYKESKGLFSQFFSMEDPTVWKLLMNYYKNALNTSEITDAFLQLDKIDQKTIKTSLKKHSESEDQQLRESAQNFLKKLQKKEVSKKEMRRGNMSSKKMSRFWTPPSATELFTDFVKIGIIAPQSEISEEDYDAILSRIQNQISDHKINCTKCQNYEFDEFYCKALKKNVMKSSICIRFNPDPQKFENREIES
jgi:hypothetical protein